MAPSAPHLSHGDLRGELAQIHRRKHRSHNTAFFGRGDQGTFQIDVDRQSVHFDIVPVQCELALRRALLEAETTGRSVVLLVDYEDRLPLDVQGRLAGGHLQFVSRERRLANLFGVQRVAPALVEGPLAEALLRAGWTYNLSRSATTIDWLTAWRAFLAKTIGLALLHWNLLSPKTLPVLDILGKLAMADVFLIALYIVIVKGAGMVTIETAWGLYLFSGCILAQVLISWKSKPAALQP